MKRLTPRAGLTLLVVMCGLSLGAGVRAAVLWSDLAATLVHETGDGTDILNGAVKRDDSATDTLYFKLHVDPLSDASTEEYSAAFQLFEGGEERFGVGNALKAWAYSAVKAVELAEPNKAAEYVDLHSSRPEPAGPGAFYTYEHPHRGLESTIVFKVQYVAGGDDLVTVWLNPDLGPGATEASQPESLITRLKANASFDEVHLRHTGGGSGWLFSELEIATSFGDFVSSTSTLAHTSAGVGQGELPFAFRSWQTEQGLPQNYVRALAQTRDGYVWVGSDDGVARFDGLRFVSFGMREGLHSGPVRVLLGDRRGALWIGSVGNGLTRLLDGRFASLTVRDGLPADSITALAEDELGRIWVGTEAGLAVWENGRLSAPAEGATEFKGKQVTALFNDTHNTLWVAVAKSGIFRFQNGRFSRVTDPAVGEILQEPHCLLVDRRGWLWVGAGDDFVLHLEGQRWRVYRIPRHQTRPYVSSLAESPDGTVWAASAGEGLVQFKGEQPGFISARSGLSDTTVESLLMDHDGVLWVGTHGGLNRLRRRDLFVFGAGEGLGHGAVHGLAEVSSGIIWAGKPSEGLYRWEGRNFSRLAVAGLTLGGPQVSALLQARDGSCWVAGARGLLHFKDPSRAASQGELFALAGRGVISLFEAADGAIWVGTREGELWQLSHGVWAARTNLWQDHPLTAIVQTAEGTVFLGTDGGGLHEYSGTNHTRWDKQRGLLSELIRTLYLEADGTLWIGTAGGGLSRWRKGNISTFTTREGLPDNTVSQLLEDDAGRFWLGSNRGIACVQKRELDQLAAGKLTAIYPEVYGRAEGMPSEECTGGFYPAGLKTKAGTLWFSTLKGIVVAAPSQRASEAPAPPVLLDEVLVDGAPASAGHATDSRAPPAETLRLAPGRHRLELVYTAVNFEAPERVRFRYRLEGLDADWVEAGTRRSALYSYVPPGHYRFRVAACNSEGIWSQAGTTLPLVVLPYFWQTRWFLGSSLLGLLVSVAGGVRLVGKKQLQRRLKRLEQERMLEQERTRIARDLHDEMGAKLCRISFLSAHARRCEGLPAELQQQVTSISNDSREVLHSLDEIVWAVNPENDTLEHVVTYLGQYAQDYFQETGIECELDIPSKVPRLPLSSQWRHHLFLAVRETLANVLKHSHATRVKISIRNAGPMLEIAIADNGKGFVPSGNGANDSDSRRGFGNGLSNIRRRLLEIGGHCEVSSEPGRGTVISFTLAAERTRKEQTP